MEPQEKKLRNALNRNYSILADFTATEHMNLQAVANLHEAIGELLYQGGYPSDKQSLTCEMLSEAKGKNED